MDRKKWGFLGIGLGIVWVFKITNLLPGEWFGNLFHEKYLFPVLVILVGFFLFVRNKYPRYAPWVLWLALFLTGLWLISTTYNEDIWI